MSRPLKFQSIEELEEKINEYFVFADKNKKPYTVTGLALFLDVDRKTITNYEDYEEFFPTIKRAKTKIENWLEENALMGLTNPTISIFNLKNNFGWVDKQEVESNNKNDNTVHIKLEGELQKWAK